MELAVNEILSRGTQWLKLAAHNSILSHKKGEASNKEMKGVVVIDGESLTPETLLQLATGEWDIALSEDAWNRINASRALVDRIVQQHTPVYGINTGFGNFATVSIPATQLSLLQHNLITSHAAGTGDALTIGRTRMLMALRINVLAKGFSGIAPSTVQAMIHAFNKSCLALVPLKGTVGASGDLAPLSHLALGLIGQGDIFNPTTARYEPALSVLQQHGLKPIQLAPKEGLALINGTQFMTSLGAEAVVRAQRLCRTADIIGALTLEVLRGTPVAFDKKIHDARPHPGQIKTAERLRLLLGYDRQQRSTLSQSHYDCNQVQDSYTLRCMPQVHGICADTCAWVYGILHTELNSATDNPMIFAHTEQSLSGGNFHGEYPAKALDYLAIGIHELASISERRIERLVNPSLSGLPAFLVKQGGLNSGFMIAHCTAAALVSENKVLTHPSSVDSIPTSAAKEDHVSMGGYSARKALDVISHVETVLAIELLCACQALDLLRPLKTTPPLESVWERVREAGVDAWDRDRVMATEIERVRRLIEQDQVWEVVNRVQPLPL